MYVSKAGYRGKKTMIYVDRNGNRTKGTTGQDRLLKFIYTHTATRLLIRPFLSPWVSKLGGTFLSTRLSAVAIRPFVEKNQINLSQYEKQEFASYNEFFTRKIKAEERPVEMDEEVLISPCDGKVSVYPICEKGKFEIKHTAYTAEQLLQDAHLAKHYYGGWIYILRLTVDDYHRYCYVADGIKSSQKKIKGIRSRLLTYLSMESVKAGNTTFQIPFDRQQLADYLNVDRTALSKELGKMRTDGILDFYKNKFTLRSF